MTATDRSGSRTWRGIVPVVLAVAWIWGIGSVAAIVLAAYWLGRDPRPADRGLLRAGLALGVVGLVATLLLVGLLTGATPS